MRLDALLALFVIMTLVKDSSSSIPKNIDFVRRAVPTAARVPSFKSWEH
jgi:hypothetical protein